MNDDDTGIGEEGEVGEDVGEEGELDHPEGTWSGPFPEKFKDRLVHFDKVYRNTAQALFDWRGDQYRKWFKKLTEWGLTRGKDKWEFLYQVVTIHKERLWPLEKAWPHLYGLTANDIKENFKEYSHFFGNHTKFVSDVIRQGFDVRGYEWELKIDEIISKIGTDLGIGDWIQTNMNAARSRSKQRARVSRIVVFVAQAILTYGISTTLGITAKVEDAVIEAKLQYVKGSLWAQMSGWLKVIEAGLEAFLTAIHYDTLHAVHRIAYLTSKDYRQTIDKVYRELSKASEALGFPPYYLHLLMQNLRTIVLDVSTSMGRSYDAAQMEWYNTFDTYLEVFSTRAFRYRDEPSLLFYDLEQLVERPALDTKSAGSRAVFDSIKTLIDGTKTTVVSIKKVSDDIDQLVFDLPENIRKEIGPFTSKITQKVDDFIVNTYEPSIGMLDNVIVAIRGQNETISGDLKGVIGRLAKPADYLLEIDQMPWSERMAQQRKIEELNTRSYRGQMEALSKETQPEYEHLSSIAAAWEKITLVSIEFPTEIETPIHPPGVEPEKRKTWFCGDY